MPDKVTLPDIPRGHTWSEAYRAECEARGLAAMGKQQRQRYIVLVRDKRGEEAARKLWDMARRMGK